MTEGNSPQGPDLTQGVPSGDVAEGAMLAGHVGEDAVLVARVDGALYAIGAECTHYHGPLAQGLIRNGAVRCPWHHACFSLKTGEATGAPAFDPVACYDVAEVDGKVVVAGKRAADAVTPRTATALRVVIIGGGAGGFAAAEMLRRMGFPGDLVVISADADAPYDRPNCSKDFLAGTAPAEWMPLRPLDYYRDQNIDLRLETTVARFSVDQKIVTLADGETIPFDALILATGAEPKRPSIAGLDGQKVFVLRSLQDARSLVEAAATAKTAAVIGASFIGLEAAAALRKRGLDVHVAAPDEVPLAKVLGADVGRFLRRLHEDQGVHFHLNETIHSFADGVLRLGDGASILADIVIVGAGVTPRVDLAEAAGLRVDDGVVVDDRLRAAPDVYAVGDIARYPDPRSGRLWRIEHWVHAQRQGQHVARLIMGEDAPFTDPPFFWSAHYDAAVHYSGHAETFDPPTVEGTIEGYHAVVRYEQDGTLLAIATLDRDLASLEAEVELEAGEPRRR